MRPPICDLCQQKISLDQGGLVYFKQTEAEKKAVENRPTGWVGHPSNAFWFCGKHYNAAQKLQHLASGEAFKILKNQ